MRRYNIVSGILLIIFIIDFAFAAPVPVQEKSRACDDVVQVTKDVITVLGKRVEEGLEKLAEGYLKTLGNPVDSSWAHASAESAPSAPDGRTSVVQAQQASSSASSTTNPDYALVGPSRPSPEVPQVHEVEGGSENAGSDDLHGPPPSPASSEVGLNEGLTEALNPNPGPSTDSDFDWDHWMKEVNPPSPRPALSKPSDPKPSTDSDFDWSHWTKVVNSPSPRPASSTGSRFNWKINLKKLVNLKGTPPSGPGSSQPSNQKPSTGSGINWKNLIKFKKSKKFKDAPAALSPDQASSSLPSSQPWNPKPSTKSRLSSFANNVIDLLGKLDPLPRPLPRPPAKPDSDVWESLSNWDPNLVSAPRQPLPSLKISPPNTEQLKEPGVEPVEVEVIHEPPSSPDSEPHSVHQSLSPASPGPQQEDPEAALYRAKGKAKVIEKVSFYQALLPTVKNTF